MLERLEPAHAAKVKSHFAHLCQLSLADAFLTKDELDYLNKLCYNYNLDQADLDYIMENAYTIPFCAPKTSMERLEQMYDLVRLVLIDESIDERKVKLCVEVAEKLGFKAHIVGDLIKALVNVTEETGESTLPKDDLQIILKEG
jgi:hypothetical protein